MKALPFILFLSLLFADCKKTGETPYKYQGVLIGYDNRECPAPGRGGLKISIKNDTAKNPPPFYLISSTLPQLGINASTKFPINVSFNYKPDTGILAKYHYIVISQIIVVK